jgi:hypothetical protein
MRTALISALICFCMKLQAQPYFDVAAIQYQYSPDKSYSGNDGNPMATHYLQGQANLPLKIYKKDLLLINPVFEMTHLDFKNETADDFHLYGLTMALTYMKQWKDPKWKTAFVGLIRLSSDLKNITAEHLQPGCAMLVIYERSHKVRYKLGVFYSAEFFGTLVLPLAGIDWKITDRLTLHGLVPRSMFLEYKVTPRVYAGIATKTVLNSYRYQSFNPHDYIKIEENHVRLFVDYYLTRHIVFNVEAGHTFFREYHQRSVQQRMEGLDSDMMVNDGLLFKASFIYRVRLDDDSK